MCVRGMVRDQDIRVLVNEAATVVDLVVDDQEQVLLGVMLGHLLEGKFLGVRHGVRWDEKSVQAGNQSVALLVLSIGHVGQIE